VRIESIDDEYAERLNFVRQEFTLAGEEEKVEPTFTEKPKKAPKREPEEPTFTDKGNTKPGGGGGGSSKGTVIGIIAAVLVVAFLGWKFMGGKSEPKEVLYNEIKVADPTVTMKVDETKVIELQVNPTDATESINWTTSDSTYVALTPNGKAAVNLTAKKRGEVKVTATAEKSGLNATFTVNIKKKTGKTGDQPGGEPQSIDCKSLSMPEFVNMKIGDEKTLNVTITPKNTDETLIWKSYKPSFVSVTQSGKIKALQEGTAVIEVRSSRTDKEASTTVRVNSSQGGGQGSGHTFTLEKTDKKF
jgi:uncharacterized protein YjdB